MGIELPFGLPLWPTAIGWLVAGILAEVAVADGGIRDSPILAAPVIVAGIVFGKLWGLVAGAGLIGVFRALWIIFIFSVFIGLMVLALWSHARFKAMGAGQVQGNVQVPAVWTPPVQPFQQSQPCCNGQPTIMYHGTPEWENALDIYSNNRWKFTGAQRIFMTPVFRAAQHYAKRTGFIIEVYVHPSVGLQLQKDHFYYAPIPDGEIGKYYQINGVQPRRILDRDGKQVRP